jgi:HK97 family phage major capsid protein
MNVRNIALEELLAEMERAEVLASKENLTAQEERQFTRATQNIKLLSAGITGQEIGRAKVEKLRQELGLPSDLRRTRYANAEARAAWTEFCLKQEVRTSYQSQVEWGNVVGLTQGTQGGYFVPPEYDSRLFASLAAVDEVLADGNCNVVETTSGAAMTTPAVDDVSGSPLVAVASSRIGEAVESDLTTNYVRAKSVQWSTAPTYRSGIVFCSTEIDQDSNFAMLTLLEEVFNRRHALGFGREVINGNGAPASGGTPTVPYGIRSACPTSTNITANNVVTSNFIDDLRRLFFALPVQYRRAAKFYMSSNTQQAVAESLETVLRSKGDKNGFDTLFNRDVVVCDSLPDYRLSDSPVAGNSKAILFADPKYILVRHVKNASYIRRFTQGPVSFSEAGLVGFQSYFRADAQPMLYDSVQPPVASLNTIG